MTVASKNTTEKYGVVSASKIIGEAVVNRQNEDLGKIHELVIDAKEGRLAYAVLSFGASWVWGTNCSPCLGRHSSSPRLRTNSSSTGQGEAEGRSRV